MWIKQTWIGAIVVCAAVGAAAAAVGEAHAAAPPKPVAGQQVYFQEGTWSAVPQAGPGGKMTQCVLVAPRPRAGPTGPIGTALSLIIGHGAGLSFSIMDNKIPPQEILDDEGEVVLDGVSHPADAFTVTANDLAFHPGARRQCWPLWQRQRHYSSARPAPVSTPDPLRLICRPRRWRG